MPTVVGCGGRWGDRTTAPVGSFKDNDFGLYDTAGNVWEWVEDCYHDNYEDAPTDGAPRLDGECTGRVLRGGSWNDEPKVVRSASRDWKNPGTSSRSTIGFRVARPAD
jgi:formylglycine-generating enzyme required for sulfatase activity